MDERPKLPHYDPDYCFIVAKWAACVCVGIFVIELVGLIFFTPDEEKCQGWTFYAENGSATPAWILAGIFTGLPAAVMCYVALRWKQKIAQEVYDSVAYRDDQSMREMFPNMGFRSEPQISPKARPRELDFEKIFLLNANMLFLRGCVMWCLFCSAPLLMMLAKCTNVPRYFGF